MILSGKKRFRHEPASDAFVLTYDKMRRYEGAWHVERKELFPDYVFLESSKSSEESEARQYGAFFQLDRETEALLKSLCGEAHHLKMSRGVIRNGVTKVLEGPLLGRESQIRKIDRHKRLARVEISAEGVFGYVPAGLEIVEKR